MPRGLSRGASRSRLEGVKSPVSKVPDNEALVFTPLGVTCPMKGGCQEKTSPVPAALDISGSQPLNVRDGLAV